MVGMVVVLAVALGSALTGEFAISLSFIWSQSDISWVIQFLPGRY